MIIFVANAQTNPVSRRLAFMQQLLASLALHAINAILFGLFATFTPVNNDVFQLWTTTNDAFLAICLIVAGLTVLFADSTAKTYSIHGKSDAARTRMMANLAWSWLASFVALAAILPIVVA